MIEYLRTGRGVASGMGGDCGETSGSGGALSHSTAPRPMQRMDTTAVVAQASRLDRLRSKVDGGAATKPEVSFAMIGGPMLGAEKLYENVREEALEIDNVDFVGGVPYSDVNSYFARTKLFLNTSDSEGFPNSFLQAWVRRVPVVSFFDPDGLIAGKGLGISVETQNDFVEALAGLISDDDLRRHMGQQARQFVIDRYSPRVVAVEYERLFAENLGISLDDG